MHLPAASTQHLPAISPLSAHIEMEVIVMGGVIIRAEHRSTTLAGSVVDDLKETPRAVIAVPVVLDRVPAAIYIGRAHAWTRVTNAPIVCSLVFEKKKTISLTCGTHSAQ